MTATDEIAFLAAHHTMTLATIAEDGSAHAASLLYALVELSLVWTSDPSSRHSLHLAREPRVAATVAPDYDNFQDIRGVQIHGTARRLTAAHESGVARGALRLRYPFLETLSDGPPALAEAWKNAAFYRLDPSRITFIDNTRGFGHKTTVELP